MASSTDEENFNIMKKAYNSCIKENVIKEVGVKPLVNLIQSVAQTFPVDESTSTASGVLGNSGIPGLTDTILLLEEVGISTFLYLGTGADDKNPVNTAETKCKYRLTHDIGCCDYPSFTGWPCAP